MKTNSSKRRGFALFQCLAVLTAIAVLTIIFGSRYVEQNARAKAEAEMQYRDEIKAAVERWHAETGTFPARDLSDIGMDATFFPNGLPLNPVSGQRYSLDEKYRVK